jgi:hypothetical protein
MSHTQMSCQIRSIDNVQNGMLEWAHFSSLVKCRSYLVLKNQYSFILNEMRFTKNEMPKMEVNDHGYDGTCGAD